MQARHLGRLGAIVVGAALYVSGCGFAIKYHPDPASAATPVKGNVSLKIVDARPADHGGNIKNHVGNARGSFAIPVRINDSNMDVVPRTVGEATTDALGRAGVATKGGPKTLVATISNFWADGFVGYAAQIAVLYELQDSAGKQLWSSQAKGGAGGARISTGLYEKALSDLAAQAAAQFSSSGFQQALAM